MLASRNRGQEDLYLINTNGTGLRNLTNDRQRDRNPRWSSEGQTIVFYSDRGGTNYDIWSISRDGSGLRRWTTVGNRYHPVLSPDGQRLSATDITTWESFLYDPTDLTKPPERLPAFPLDLRRGGTGLQPTGWSSTGRYLVGYTGFTSRWPTFIYGRLAREYRRLGGTGANPRFLPGDDRVLIAVQPGQLAVVDVASGESREVLALPGERLVWATPSPDGRYVYAIRVVENGDIWTVRLGSSDEGTARTP